MFLVAAFFIAVSAYHHGATTHVDHVVPIVPYICYDFCA